MREALDFSANLWKASAVTTSSSLKDLTFSIYDLARFVDRSVQTIRYHIRINALPAQKIKGARATRVKAADAEKWAARYFGKDISGMTAVGTSVLVQPASESADLSHHAWL